MGEAGRPGGQRCSDMTAAAVGVGGLALWRGHPARAQVSTVERCACIGPPPLHPPEYIFHRHYVSAYSERERRAGGVGEAPDLPYSVLRSQSRTSVNDARPWKLYTPPGIHVAVSVAM